MNRAISQYSMDEFNLNKYGHLPKIDANKISIMSVQRSTYECPVNINNVHLDEATMCDYISLLRVFNTKFKKLYLYGDSNQIGMLDTSTTAGTRVLTNIL